MFKINTEGQAFLYNLLVNSKFRIWRHILFIVSLAAISFNQTYVIFQPEIPALGTRLYWIALGNLASYLAVAYLRVGPPVSHAEEISNVYSHDIWYRASAFMDTDNH